MTKYILHGGKSREINADNQSFFAEMTLGTRGSTKILLNYFSRKDEEVMQLAQQDQVRITDCCVHKELEFEIADPDNLAEQLRRTHVMYMRGGETDWLVEKSRKTANLENLLDGKVIAGSSAGVYALAKYYWSNDNKCIGNGLGILNIKAFCHYTPQEEETIHKLLAYHERLPLLTLPEYKWIVMYNEP